MYLASHTYFQEFDFFYCICDGGKGMTVECYYNGYSKNLYPVSHKAAPCSKTHHHEIDVTIIA